MSPTTRLIHVCLWAAALALAACGSSLADEPTSQGPPSKDPKKIPLTRPEMKGLLEGLKNRQPRLPLPPPAEGDPPTVNNGRMRMLYLPKEWSVGFPTAKPKERAKEGAKGKETPTFRADPAMTLDNTFKVKLFWITSRTNNCQYCLGHQELKLRNDGLNDDEIAALDGDWSEFSPADRAAMHFTRLLTLDPQTVGDADVAALRRHYKDAQVVEIVQTVAGYNSTNRWTDSLGIPQDRSFATRKADLDTPTAERFRELVTQVAPLKGAPRAALESRAKVEAAWAECRNRQPRVAITGLDEARKAVSAEASAPLPNWVRALSYFPQTATRQWKTYNALQKHGRIPALLKAQLAWTTARNNRAWYALADARRRLSELGVKDDAMFALDGETAEGSAAQREALAFARKLTVDPRGIADDDIARLRKLYADAEVAEIVFVVCQANWFDRLTEALGLPLEG